LDTHQDAKTILLSGGGTGGHITPILAVATELKRQNPSVRTIYVGEKGGKFQELTASHSAIDETRTIWAGKFRRYNGESWFNRIMDVRTNLLNFRDIFYFVIGTLQSLRIIRKAKPDVVFLKGGFVGVPIGLAAAIHKVPFITHDSDALPGLANRIVSRWAKTHAVALAPDTYPYPSSKTVQVGVLVESDFKHVDANEQQSMKQRIKVPAQAVMVLVTGGSSGANNINQAMKQIAEKLLQDYLELYIVHQAGKGKAAVYGEYSHDRLQVIEFMRPMYVYTGAADIVVSRASGNTIAELGVQGKAVIAVPNPLLTGGHQLKNAKTLTDMKAALIVSEINGTTNVMELDGAIRELLENPATRKKLAQRLQSITITGAAEKLAALLLK
jgi:UDP-N-acetylglucosamine--N-acetylmuramyl-(pentapeptide) pyrophosphoryl-undecaprenol N-acetylglucosamine transferase